MDHNSQFPSTPWTKLREAVSTDPCVDRAAAMNDLCSRYWYPLYAFARWKGCSHEDAEDQTQIFLSRLIERNSLEHADASKGRLRTYLLSAFQHQLINHWEHARAARRGGNATMLSLDMGGAEERFAHEPPDPSLSPEEQFDRVWALSLIDHCLADMAADHAGNVQGDAFAALRPFLNPLSVADTCVADVSARLGLTEVAVRQRIFRLRAEFSRALRAHVAGLLCEPTPEAIEEEMRSLRQALERS